MKGQIQKKYKLDRELFKKILYYTSFNNRCKLKH